MDRTARQLIDRLGLAPLPVEGGWFRSLWRSADGAACSCIHYLLRAGEVSRWHRLSSDEVWTWHAGGSLEMTRGGDGPRPGAGRTVRLGPRPGEDFAAAVPAGAWQTTRVADGAFALVSCVVAPAYRDEDCEFLPEEDV